ncbi:MAG: 4-hydroxy-3-methylbut-2-en-1-yl diphosphate synthase [Ginsengibacter sp.]
MTTTDTMDTAATVAQSIRCIEAGAELVRITAPSKKEAENLINIKNELRNRGYNTPLVADIHFTPNAAEIAARIVEKVRVNPGNYVDKKKFEQIEYSDSEYAEEIERITQRFTPLVKICKEYGTAMRIGTNHGSLSDRIMSRFGDTPMGMVESAMEFLRIAEAENYYNIVLSMKSSNPQVMVEAYRMLIEKMHHELGSCYPLHLGVTEAGDGEDGRIKSAIGIGTLLEEGIGDTIRVSLTEDPEFELPVCKDIVKRYSIASESSYTKLPDDSILNLASKRKIRNTKSVLNIGTGHVPVVISDLARIKDLTPKDLSGIGYSYDSFTDKWNINDSAADYIFTNSAIDFELPGTVGVIKSYDVWLLNKEKSGIYPLLDAKTYLDDSKVKSGVLNFLLVGLGDWDLNKNSLVTSTKNDNTVVICLMGDEQNGVNEMRNIFDELNNNNIERPVVFICNNTFNNSEERLIHFAIECGALLIDGLGNGLLLSDHFGKAEVSRDEKEINSIAFGILQATRTRISKTEYISCPSCGRTLFDLQETTAKIRAVTNHLKGVKIAIMGCIVNGPGEMADADFGYVGSGPGKITLYKGKEVIKRSVGEDVAVAELINLIKENEAWVEPPVLQA